VICISRGLIWQRVRYLTLSSLLLGTNGVDVITEYLSSNHFHHQWIGRLTKTRENGEIDICSGSPPHWPRMSVKDRQAGWGPHHEEWSDDACVATQLRLSHGLAWIPAVSWTEFKLQGEMQSFCMTKGLLHSRTGMLARVYVRVCNGRGVH